MSRSVRSHVSHVKCEIHHATPSHVKFVRPNSSESAISTLFSMWSSSISTLFVENTLRSRFSVHICSRVHVPRAPWFDITKCVPWWNVTQLYQKSTVCAYLVQYFWGVPMYKILVLVSGRHWHENSDVGGVNVGIIPENWLRSFCLVVPIMKIICNHQLYNSNFV